MINNFLNTAKEKLMSLKNEAMKFKSKEFLQASLAGSALIILADGSVDKEEKLKMMKFIEHNEALSIYDTSEVLTTFKEYLAVMEEDMDIGEAKAMTAISKIKNKEEQARLVMRMIIAIANADNDFDPDEKAMAVRIANELGLDPTDFDLS